MTGRVPRRQGQPKPISCDSGLAMSQSGTGCVAPHRQTFPPTQTVDRIIRLKTVLARTGLSRSTIYRKIADGSFPRQVAIGTHSAGWRESAINRWIENPTGWRCSSEEAVRLRDEQGEKSPLPPKSR